MLLVFGVLLINVVWDILVGNFVSGFVCGVEVMLSVVVLGFGIVVVIILF